jgi:hypothetical protein
MASPLVDIPKHRFRAWFRKIWDVRGGGLYAVGFAATFLYLEILSLADDVLGIGAIFNGQIIEFVINFFLDSLSNTIAAFMWPVDIVRWNSPWGAVLLGIAFWLFPIYVKPYIEEWLFDGEEPQAEEADSAS